MLGENPPGFSPASGPGPALWETSCGGNKNLLTPPQG